MPWFKSLRLGALALLCWSLMPWAQAITFAPMEHTLATNGRKATHVYRLENSSGEVAAVEISIHRRHIGADGSEQLSPATDEFMLFPSQVVLQPGQVQSVRVQYIGAAQIESELAYRLIAEQLPVEMDPTLAKANRMRMLLRYMTSLYVSPAQARAQLESGAAKLIEEGGKRWLQLEVKNTGTAHKVLQNSELVQGTQRWKDEQLPGVDGTNLLARSQRLLRVPVPPGLTHTDGLQLRWP